MEVGALGCIVAAVEQNVLALQVAVDDLRHQEASSINNESKTGLIGPVLLAMG